MDTFLAEIIGFGSLKFNVRGGKALNIGSLNGILLSEAFAHWVVFDKFDRAQFELSIK
jgi:hypothetical protein